MALTFFWRCEGETLDATHDFTAGDNSATVQNSVSISNTAAIVGSNGILIGAGNSHYRFDGASIVSGLRAEGAYGFWFRLTSHTGTPALTIIRGVSANDFYTVLTSGNWTAGTGNITFQRRSSDTGGAQVSITTDSGNLAINQTYFVVVRWDQPNSLSTVEIYNSSLTLIDSATNNSAFVQPLDLNTTAGIRIGEASGTAITGWIDNFFIADSYDEPIVQNALITSYTDYDTSVPSEITGAGGLGLVVPVASGTAVRGLRDLGGDVELFGPTVVLAGSGEVGSSEPEAITGSGTLEGPLPEVAGLAVGPGQKIGLGVLFVPPSSLIAAGVRGVSGEGVLIAARSFLNGVGPDVSFGERFAQATTHLCAHKRTVKYAHGRRVS